MYLAPYFFEVSCWQKPGQSSGSTPWFSPRHRLPMPWQEAQPVQNVPCFLAQTHLSQFPPIHAWIQRHACFDEHACFDQHACFGQHACLDMLCMHDMPCMHRLMRASMHDWHVKPNATTSPDTARQREHLQEIVTWSRPWFTYNNSGLLMEDWMHHPNLVEKDLTEADALSLRGNNPPFYSWIPWEKVTA